MLLPHVTHVIVFQGQYVNRNGSVCHDPENSGDRSAFAWHLSPIVNDFVLKLLRDSQSVPQIMIKHIEAVKEALRNGQDLHQDMFFDAADVRNLATKIAKETYMLDKK